MYKLLCDRGVDILNLKEPITQLTKTLHEMLDQKNARTMGAGIANEAAAAYAKPEYFQTVNKLLTVVKESSARLNDRDVDAFVDIGKRAYVAPE